MTSLTIRISEGEKEKLNMVAKYLDRSVSYIVRQAIGDMLDQYTMEELEES